MVEDVEVGSGTSSTIKSAKHLPLDIAEDAKVGGNDDGSDNEIVKRSLSKKSRESTEYFTSLHSNIDSASFEKK